MSFITVEKADDNEPESEQERSHSAEVEKQNMEQSEKDDHVSPGHTSPDHVSPGHVSPGHTSPQQQDDGSQDYMFSVGRDQVLRRAKLTEYDSFALAVLKPLLGEYHVRRLLTKGVGPRKIENAVLAKSSWQRVPLMVDPYNKGLELIRTIQDGENLLEIDLAER